MRVDLKALDDKIRKLQEFRKLVADPDLAAFIGEATSPNGQAQKRTPAYESELGNDVVTTIAGFSGDFTVSDAYEAMLKSGYKFKGDEPKKSIGNILREFALDGGIKIVKPGKGRRATVYSGQ
jgi:hypothetical protein